MIKRETLHDLLKKIVSSIDGMVTLDDPPEISSKDLVKIVLIREYLQQSYKNGVILQV